MRQYGTLDYHAPVKKWVIACEPHVSIRLKRVFGCADTLEFGTVRLSATPENSRDLQWFMERYPLRARNGAHRLLAQLAAEHKEREALVDALLAKRRPPSVFNLAIPLRDYQSFAAELWRRMKATLLADDVGLGKTAVAIAGINHGDALPALVVTLAHLPQQWAAECQKFAPDLSTHILTKGQPYDLTMKTGRLPDVIISNYHKLSGWAETLAPLIQSIVFDECQELRHRRSQKYGAAAHLAESASYKIGLSATPIYNYGGEIFNVLDVLCPDRMGTHSEFLREWCTHTSNTDKARIREPRAFGLYARQAGLILRRTRTEVGRELPEVTVVPHHVEANEGVFDSLTGEAVELAKLILRQHQDYKGQKMQAAAEFDMRMRQATGIAKAPFVAEFVKFLVRDTDEKVVLYGWHRAVYDLWLERLREFNPVLYTGSESPREKELSKQAFVAGVSKILIISLRAGQGVDGLQNACRVVVFGELDWSPGVLEQCLGRVHRDGQGQPVTAYYMLSTVGADPIMADVLGLKKSQIEGLRDPTLDLVTKLQADPEALRRLAENYLASQGVKA